MGEVLMGQRKIKIRNRVKDNAYMERGCKISP